MTIDERIEALTLTLELSVLENRDRDARWDKQQAEWEKQRAQSKAEWDKRQAEWDKLTRFVGESLARLADTAVLHQHLLNSHEDRLDTLEGTA